jgi:molybdenum-dependent DNA-binding transcriptional regulator ModE
MENGFFRRVCTEGGLSMPDMRSLELLVGLADRGSYTQVARRMQISVGAASKMISRLEKELGVRLLNRTTRLVSLTQQGRLLAEKSRLALAEMAEAIDLIHLEQRGPVGTVRPDGSPVTSQAFLRGRAALGMELSESVEARMKMRIKANPERSHGVHEYAAEHFGLSAAGLRDAFREYIDHFSVR